LQCNRGSKILWPPQSRPPRRVIGAVETPSVFRDAARVYRIAVACKLRVPSGQTNAARLDLKMKPIAGCWYRAGQLTEPGWCCNYAEKRERLRLVRAKTLQQFSSHIIDIFRVDAIELKRGSTVRTRT
jgi:hypothetical protein